MISCKRAAEWTSRELDEPLPPFRRFAVGLHRLLCPACRRFRDQLRAVNLALNRHLASTIPESDERLTEDARRRIRQALLEETKPG
jgi:hypothetical protein